MAFIYDLNTDVGKVRLLITDTDEDNPIFQDYEIDVFLSMTATSDGNDLRLASALALETIARSEVLVQKRITLLDLQTDGPSVAKELRESAKLLREEAESEGDVDWIEMGLTNANRYEIIFKDALRNE